MKLHIYEIIFRSWHFGKLTFWELEYNYPRMATSNNSLLQTGSKSLASISDLSVSKVYVCGGRGAQIPLSHSHTNTHTHTYRYGTKDQFFHFVDDGFRFLHEKTNQYIRCFPLQVSK